MSQTQFVESSTNGFWAYDVALRVFLKYLIDAAEASNQAKTQWLSEGISSWRSVACFSDYGLTLKADWSREQQQTFITLAEGACSELAERTSIAAEEIISWSLLDGLSVSPRGATEVLTAPVVELGRAIIELVSGSLPEAPSGTCWVYGVPAGRL